MRVQKLCKKNKCHTAYQTPTHSNRQKPQWPLWPLWPLGGIEGLMRCLEEKFNEKTKYPRVRFPPPPGQSLKASRTSVGGIGIIPTVFKSNW